MKSPNSVAWVVAFGLASVTMTSPTFAAKPEKAAIKACRSEFGNPKGKQRMRMQQQVDDCVMKRLKS